jgi:hypothetical protein
LQEILANANQLAAQIAERRGLPLREALVTQEISQSEVRARLLRDFEKDFKPGEIEGEALCYKRLGFLPKETDYKQLWIDILTEQIAGFYSADEKRLYVVKGLLPQEIALAHEIEHALQDQSYDIKKSQEQIKPQGSDALLAYSSLLEGDATGLMIEFALGWKQPFSRLVPANQDGEDNEALDSTPAMQRAPALVREGLVFPYTKGVSFLAALRKDQPWSAVDKIFASPPRSTEQILHPERYLSKDEPSVVPIFALPSLGAESGQLFEGVLGEFQWRVLFAQFLPKKEAYAAADGWDGDRVMAFGGASLLALPPGKPDLSGVTVGVVSLWDSEKEAKEAEAALQKVGAGLFPKSPEGSASPAVALAGDGFWLERRGARLVFAVGSLQNLAGVGADLWAASAKASER